MKVFYAKRSEVEDLRKATEAIFSARRQLDLATAQLAMAGCGTFNTTNEHKSLSRMAVAIERIYQRLGRRLDIASANAPALNPNTSGS